MFPVTQSNSTISRESVWHLQYQYGFLESPPPRTDAIDIERAKSREILVTSDALTSSADQVQNGVTTGPG